MPNPQPLEFVEPSPAFNMNALLYGPPKSGKTTGAASAPGPILYVNADTPNATRYAHGAYGKNVREIRMKGLQTFVDVTEAIEKGGKFKSVVLDPIGDVYRILLEELSGRALSPKIQTYGDTGTHLERFCRKLCELPINAAFVCHETAVKDEASGSFERLPYTGTQNPTFGAKLMGMVDVIGYCGVRIPQEEGQPAGEPEYVAQLVNGGGRRGGDRFGVLGISQPLNLTDWVRLATDAPKPVQERKAA